MKLNELVRNERIRRGYTQEQVARYICIQRGTYATYETGIRPFPLEILRRTNQLIKSPILKAQICFLCGINLMTMPWLDRVDHHPITVTQKTIVEMGEAAGELRKLDLTNKLSAADLSEEDCIQMYKAGEQLADLYAAIPTLFGSWQEHYNFDTDRLAINEYEKLFSKGCATRQSYDDVLTAVAR